MKRNSDTINTNLITIKIDTLQHYSPNCAMHKQAMKNTEVALVVFTDYSKEFVTIDFSILIEEMHKLTLPRRFLYWNFSYLTERQHCCTITFYSWNYFLHEEHVT